MGTHPAKGGVIVLVGDDPNLAELAAFRREGRNVLAKRLGRALGHNA